MGSNENSHSQRYNIYRGFCPPAQRILSRWEKRVIKFDDDFIKKIALLNQDLEKNNIILFFDHHYAFDALPLGIAIGRYLVPTTQVVVPYAVHLEMGLGRLGEPSLRYWIRTRAFRWFINRVIKGNREICFYPVSREFELDTPRLKRVVEKEFEGINTRYIRNFIRRFTDNASGQMCFLTPFSGIGFPGKPVLHKQLYRSVKLVRKNSPHNILFFITGAYPDWDAYNNYLAPLFMEHRVLIQGPFEVPLNSYSLANQVIEQALGELRESAQFVLPDYSQLLMK
jgi:hypothetical protein